MVSVWGNWNHNEFTKHFILNGNTGREQKGTSRTPEPVSISRNNSISFFVLLHSIGIKNLKVRWKTHPIVSGSKRFTDQISFSALVVMKLHSQSISKYSSYFFWTTNCIWKPFLKSLHKSSHLVSVCVVRAAKLPISQTSQPSQGQGVPGMHPAASSALRSWLGMLQLSAIGWHRKTALGRKDPADFTECRHQGATTEWGQSLIYNPWSTASYI